MALTDAVRKLIAGTLGTVNLRNSLERLFDLYTEEAPEDGTPYARQDGAWVAAGGGAGGLTALTATLSTESSSVLAVGTDRAVIVPIDITITVTDSWVIASDTSASVVVDVQRATVAAPTTFTSIAASAKPALTADTYSTGAMTGWSTSILAGEQIRLVVESASGTTEVRVMFPVSAA